MSSAQRSQLRRLVARFKEKRILVLGDLMLDHYIRGSVSRMSPEAPVPVVKVSSESYVPGGAGNVAHNLASLGARVRVMGVVGPDAEGIRLTSDLAAKDINVDHVVTDQGRVTSQKCRVIAERQQAVRYDRETQGPLSLEVSQRVIARLPAALKDTQAVILSDYGKGVISPRLLKAVLSFCKRRAVPVIVDPKIENFGLYRGVSCITPNLHEAWSGMRRLPKPGEDALVGLGKDILKKLRCGSVLITRGGDGMSLFKSSGEVIHIPTQAHEVFDVTGAGDTVISVLTLGLASGAGIKEAAILSNYAAGIVVGKLGTATATVAELNEAIK